ncbi:MAG: hypothetical protein ABIN01_21900 [Ferruginibacter sp.]
MKIKFYLLNKLLTAFHPSQDNQPEGIKHLLLPSFFCRLLSRAVFLLPSHKLAVVFIAAVCVAGDASADYTVAAGTTVNASTITSQGGVLTVNGRLNVDISTVSLLNFTRVVIDGANAQIFWADNSDLKFAAGISFVITNTSLGLQPTSGNGNASTRLYIGPTVIIVSSDNSQNAAFSFEIFNYIGGLPEFTLTTSPTSLCYGDTFTAILNPLCDKINYDCSWSVSPSSGTAVTPAPGSTRINFNQPQTFKLTYPNTPQSYTLSCSITRAGAGVAFASKSVNVSVNHVPLPPTLATSSAATICVGTNITINATTVEGVIQWYTTAIGGTVLITSASSANLSVSPITNTTYYAEAKVIASGCASSTRIPVAITVSQLPVGGSINEGTNVCTGTNNTPFNLTGYSGTIQWQLSGDNSTFSNITGFTGPAFTATNLTNTTYYRALASSGVCPAVGSSVSTVAVSAASLAGSISGAVPVCTGTNSTLLTLTGNTGTIQWQSSLDNSSFSDINGATSSSITASDLSATTYYRTIITSGVCGPTTGAAVAVTVIAPAAAGFITGGAAVCLGGNNTSLTLNNYAGAVAKWQSSAAIDFSNSVADITSNAASLTVANLANTAFYRAMVTNGCEFAYTAPATISIHNVWEGTQSADWNTAANWSDGVLPDVFCPDVMIEAGTPFQPVLSSGTAAIQNLVILPGASLTVSQATLQISGTITNAGTFNVGNGTLAFAGNFTQSISGNTLASNTLKNLIVSNNLVVDNTAGNLLNLTGDIAFGDVNNVTLNTGDNLILVSTYVSTARVADITNNGVNNGNTIIGKAGVQRYLPGRRAWRMFTAPLAYGGSVFDNWQNGGVYEAGKGTYVSGPGATSPTGANGLDWSAYNNASLLAGSVPVLNTRQTRLSKNLADTSDNIAYFIFARGDRDPANTNPSRSNTTTLTSIGKLQTGRQTFTVSPVAGAFTMIGNPYASPVEFAKIGRNNVYNRYYVWDSYLNSEQGGYVVFDDINNTGTYSYTASTLTPILQSGQAFYATTVSNGPASVVFNENIKTSANNLRAYRTAGPSMTFRINLYHLNEINATVLLDGTLALFDNNFNKETDQQDALKLDNVKEMLALQRNATGLAIERRPVPAMDDTLFLQLTKTTRRSYRLGLEPINVEANLQAFLEDSYTHKQVQLSTVSASVYDFEINTDQYSEEPGRFRIIFKRIASKELPVNISVIAFTEGGNIAVEWKVDSDLNISRYEIERGRNAGDFVKVNSINTVNRNPGNAPYHWLDKNPLAGNNYYRIRYVDMNGDSHYSQPTLVTLEPFRTGVYVCPNPVEDNIISAEFKNMPAGAYSISLINSVGQVILNNEITHSAGSWEKNIQPTIKLRTGIYQLKVAAAGRQISTINVIVK